MHKALFLLCPTDCLESIINDTFKHENYFYTSLGNSFISDTETIENIKELIIQHNIRKIYFVLSDDNKIILDALGGQSFSDIRGLQKFYTEVTRQKERSEVLWQTDNRQFSILSYYLNNKIKELQLELDNLPIHLPRISGKIYFRQKNIFSNIYSDLICIEKHYLN
ncbi:hypothetical protein [Winogradskyella sp. 3972H.M.0a.05]|uniref:hypothetical protein n=1 Tax=Winogradskyella sp. 3972H.M.0a.05 TaxID=2950277 RepID=UPI0033972C3A